LDIIWYLGFFLCLRRTENENISQTKRVSFRVNWDQHGLCRGWQGTRFLSGALIHNPQEVERLRQASRRLRIFPPETRRFPHHSFSWVLRVFVQARDRGLTIIDLTCPFVGKAQRDAEALRTEGYQVVVVGEKKHPEVQSILGHAGENAVVVETAGDVEDLKLEARVGVVAQTTQTYGNFSEIVLTLLRLSKELKVFNTICSSTKERQEAARILASQVDVMLVVGGRNSANTSRLASLCRHEGKPTYHIETAGEIRTEWLEGVSSVGVTAGASTPDWVVEGVLERLRAIGREA
jgi:4-hydroxy-3-methylbut-2-enyl diphosphate reductase